jgi:hypothetical protein
MVWLVLTIEEVNFRNNNSLLHPVNITSGGFGNMVLSRCRTPFGHKQQDRISPIELGGQHPPTDAAHFIRLQQH